MEVPFQDLAAETALAAGVLKYGRDAVIDIEGLVKPDDLALEFNQVILSCAFDHFAEGTERPLDYTTLISTARRKGVSHVFDSDDAKRHLRSLMDYPVELASVEPEAAKILKLSIGKQLDGHLADARKDLKKISGDESLNAILGLVENRVFEFTARLNGENNDTKQIASGIDDWLDAVLAGPRENIGIPSPFPKYNALIGGGFRRRGISIIGARPKVGKSLVVDNVCLHAAGTLGIPVLNLDTEMSDEEHWARILAHLTGIPMGRIERGDLNKDEGRLLRRKAEWLKSIPYYYRSVIDETFEEQVAAMRRWIVKTVGTDAEGVRNDCLVAYDYLQLTDPGEFKGNDFKEYQLLGFQMVMLSRMAKRYDVPILSMLQLNRDGIDKRTTAVAAGSDRIIWKCSNFSILFKKEESEVQAHTKEEGTLWLSNLIARHGSGGTGKHDDISLVFDGATAKLAEGKTRKELDEGRKASNTEGFATDDEPEDWSVPFEPTPQD